MKHLSHFLNAGKGVLLIIAMIAFSLSGASADLAASLAERFDDSRWGILPVYWMLLSAGGLLLIFPLTLVEEHRARLRHGDDEETPAWHWLQMIGFEWLIIVALGSAASAIMHYSSLLWWAYLVVAWLTYTLGAPMVQAMMLAAGVDEEGGDRRSELLPELRSGLARAGVDLEEVRLLPGEDEMPHLHQDIYLATRRGKTTLFLPVTWTATWSIPEINAVALHKVVMDRADITREHTAMRLVQALICFGGFALVLPVLRAAGWAQNPGDITTAPWLVAWMLLVLGLLRPLEFALTKRWIFRADDAVATIMQDTEPILTALRRARDEAPEEAGEEPPWAELLFMPVPPLTQRIARLQTLKAQPPQYH